MKKRTLSALLLCALLALSACASDTSSNSTDTTSATDTTEPEITTEARITPDLPEADFDGYEFKVMTKGTTNIHWKSKDIAASEQNGEPINDAVYNRNSTVGEKYNFTISDIPVKVYGEWAKEATNVVLAGDNAYDMFCFNVRDIVKNNYIYNLYDVPHMNLDMPYYDQNVKEALTIAGKLYSITGDMLIMDNDATICVQFNKQLESDYGVASSLGAADLYELVNNGGWTIDAMYSGAKLVASDLNGNGEIDFIGDMWGFGTENSNVYRMLAGTGETIANVDSDGYPQLSLNLERATSIIELVGQIQSDTAVSLHASRAQAKFPGDSVFSDCMEKNFEESMLLFNMAGMNRVTLYRSMEVDFGVLPMPKYEESQERYYCPTGDSTSNSIAFPATMVEAERNGIIVEALSCESMYTLTPAYYDVTLEGKAIRDEESKDMLDLIFASTSVDLGYYFGFGGISSVIQNFGTFTSSYAAAETKALADIEAIMDVILGE